jgi:hypothetical protein
VFAQRSRHAWPAPCDSYTNHAMRCALLTLATALLLSAACGGRVESGPVLGTWTYTPEYGAIRSIVVTFNDDGTATEALTLGSPDVGLPDMCSGTLTLSGYSWTATANELTVAGSPTCSGTIDCTQARSGLDGPCTFPMYQLMGSLDPNSAPSPLRWRARASTSSRTTERPWASTIVRRRSSSRPSLAPRPPLRARRTSSRRTL